MATLDELHEKRVELEQQLKYAEAVRKKYAALSQARHSAHLAIEIRKIKTKIAAVDEEIADRFGPG
jgi:hypothetical protein